VPAAKNFAATLSGLRGFTVFVDVADMSVDLLALRSRLELTLRQHGIRVGADVLPILDVRCISLEQTEEPLVAFTCRLRVRQMVARRMPTPLRIYATSWESTEFVATLGKSRLADFVSA
jgi:hypothetical protein